MKRKIAELTCLGLLLIGAAGVVTSLFVGSHAQIQVVCMFAVVIVTACVAKMILTNGETAAKS